MTGVELIAQERAEQIEKHGYSLDDDANYESNELVTLAEFCMKDESDAERDNLERYLFDDENGPLLSDECRTKLLAKTPLNRLVVAGALIAAEIDRLNYSE